MNDRIPEEAALRYLDGVGDDAEVAELATRLRADPAARRGFVRVAHLHALLAELAPQPLIQPARRARWPLAVAAAAAAAALVAVAAHRLAAEPPIARVASASGEVTRVRDGARRTISAGDALAPRDQLIVGADGSLEIACAAGARVVVSAGTEIAIGTRGAPTFALERGALRAWVYAHAAGTRFAIATPDAVATDVGTTFDVRRGDDGTLVDVDTGAVEVASPTGSVVAHAGQRALAEPGRAPALVDVPAAAARHRAAPAAGDDEPEPATTIGTITLIDTGQHRLVIRDDATGTTESYRALYVDGRLDERIARAIAERAVGDHVIVRWKIAEGRRIVAIERTR